MPQNLPKVPLPKIRSKVPCRIYFPKFKRCFTTWELNKTTPLGHSKFNIIFEFTMISLAFEDFYGK